MLNNTPNQYSVFNRSRSQSVHVGARNKVFSRLLIVSQAKSLGPKPDQILGEQSPFPRSQFHPRPRLFNHVAGIVNAQVSISCQKASGGNDGTSAMAESTVQIHHVTLHVIQKQCHRLMNQLLLQRPYMY